MRTQLTLEQLIEVRKMLEPEMAALAARNASPADIERMRSYAEPPDESGYVPHDAFRGLAFHEAVAEATHNAAVSILFSTLRVLAQTKILHEDEHEDETVVEDPRPRPVPRMKNDHRAILAAIEEGDEEGAREATRLHLDNLGPYWSWVSQEPAW